MPAPRLLYAHGFASGPLSTKGRAIAEHLARRGLAMKLLDLRVPTPDGLRLSSMVNAVRWSVEVSDQAPLGTIVPISRAGEHRAVCIGSSLGALAVARASERDPRILATVLLAPAFRAAERWRKRIGEEAWATWQRTGTMEYPDHATGGTLEVDFDFITDCALVDGDDAPDDARAAEGFGPRWPDVKVPTVIVHGTRDETVDVKLSRTFAKGRPHVRLVEVDDDHQLLGSLPRIMREIDRVLAELGVA